MDAQPTKILVVDDSLQLRELLQRYLDEQGFHTSTVEDGVAMENHLAEHPADLIILDLMLPGDDGLTLARRLRASSDIPIIILSARGEDVDRIVGLEVGADDYLPKPFNPRELLARIRAVLRRRQPGNGTESTEPEARIHRFGPYQLNLDNFELSRDGEEIHLTAGELALLQVFVEHPNRLLSRDQLVDLLKGYDRSPFDRSVDVRVTRLRRKIEIDPKSPKYVRTIWGKGYLFTPRGKAPRA
jgi:DNA-binding response OmpR family regulator